MIKRLIGIVLILVAVSGMGIGFMGARMASQVVDGMGQEVDEVLGLVSGTLTNVEETLTLTKVSIQDVSTVMVTAEETAVNLSTTVSETRPLIGQVNQIGSTDLPDSLDSIQDTIPTLSLVADSVDATLRTLSSFNYNEEVLGYEVEFGLGIEYDPEVTLGEAIDSLGTSLEGISPQLRSLDVYLNVADENLETISTDLRTISGDVETINGRLAESLPLIDEYTRLTVEANDQARRIRNSLQEQLATIRTGIIVAMIWFGLTQLAPLYLGVELLFGKRE